jgi:TonB-dependent starch-binding outer membrane protein SusC
LPSSAFKYGKLRAYIALQNVLTFTKYSGYDPEVSASDNSASGYITSRGNDNLQHPNPKIYRIGLQLNF